MTDRHLVYTYTTDICQKLIYELGNPQDQWKPKISKSDSCTKIIQLRTSLVRASRFMISLFYFLEQYSIECRFIWPNSIAMTDLVQLHLQQLFTGNLQLEINIVSRHLAEEAPAPPNILQL